MESCKSIIEATATKWRWIRNCWRLRLPVREALLAPKADTTETVTIKAELEFWKTKASETDKALKEAKDANKALIHFIHTRNTPDVDLRAVKKAISTLALAFLPLLAMSQPLEPYRHNFFTTNPAPVVDVLPGTNVSVQFTTTGTSQRHYTVNTDTNLILIYGSGLTNGYPWTNIFPQGVAGGQTNQVLTQTGWSGYPQVTNLSLKTNGLGTAIVPSLWLTNPTPASLGAQQNSPALMLGGQGWRSGNSTTMPVQMGMYLLPSQGSSANPSGTLVFVQSISNAVPTSTGVTVLSGGALTASGVFANSFKDGSEFERLFTGIQNGWLMIGSAGNTGLGGLGVTGITLGGGTSQATQNQTTNFPALRTESATNNVTLGIRKGTNGVEFASLTANQVLSSNINGNVSFFTNGMAFVTAPTNGVAPPTIVQQPLGMFGSMMMATVTNTLTVGSSGTYYVVSNYTTIRTNGFVAVPSTGYLTNLYAGFYRISYFMSALPGNADQVELEIFVNGTGREEISSFHTYDNPARVDTMNGDGILYLPANSYVNLAANNRSGANNITIWRCGLTIGTP